MTKVAAEAESVYGDSFSPSAVRSLGEKYQLFAFTHALIHPFCKNYLSLLEEKNKNFLWSHLQTF